MQMLWAPHFDLSEYFSSEKGNSRGVYSDHCDRLRYLMQSRVLCRDNSGETPLPTRSMKAKKRMKRTQPAQVQYEYVLYVVLYVVHVQYVQNVRRRTVHCTW